MVLCEENECSVCLQSYNRLDRIPRLLYCRHTFCEPCLENIAQPWLGMLTVCCPLCRQVTCVGRALGLQGALWVDNTLWDQIEEDGQPEEENQVQFNQEGDLERAAQAKQQPSWSKFKLPAFLRRFSLTKQPQERIVPGSNVEMRSWRRLTEDTF